MLERVVGIHQVEGLVGEFEAFRVSLLERRAPGVRRVEIRARVYSRGVSAELLREYRRLQSGTAAHDEYPRGWLRDAAPQAARDRFRLPVAQPDGALRCAD